MNDSQMHEEGRKNEESKQLNLGIVMPNSIYPSKRYNLTWYNDTVKENITGNTVISIINGARPPIKKIELIEN